jgi:hypothetical protein
VAVTIKDFLRIVGFNETHLYLGMIEMTEESGAAI